MVDKLVERFNLDPVEVAEFFEEMKAEKVKGTVSDWQITAEQKQAILDRKTEIKEAYQALEELPPEERQAAMQEMKAEMQAWTEENDIDLKIMDKEGCGHFGGMGTKMFWK